MNLKTLSPEVSVTQAAYPSINKGEISIVGTNAKFSPRGRFRVCMHKQNEDRLHEMFIAFAGRNYVRPSYHIGKDESLLLLEGQGMYVFFDDFGKVTARVPLGTDFPSGGKFYCRIHAGKDHALVIQSDGMVVHETTNGPFRKEDTAFLAWSPEESDKEGQEKLIAQCIFVERSNEPLLNMVRTAEEVYQADQEIVCVGWKEIEFLKAQVHQTSRKRVRLCCHHDIGDSLHEMFVVYTGQTYVRPNRHIGKDESLHIIEGSADFVFFDDLGAIKHVVHLGDYKSGKDFYVRVPAGIWHTIVMRSDTIVIHEATPGPFKRQDTEWAPWAPGTLDDNVGNYIASFNERLLAWKE